MKFTDEARIRVTAGNGGNGCLGFRREKFVPKGGPDGGDGGDGGSVFLVGDAGFNTLINFRYQRLFKAENGQQGSGSNKTGQSADDLEIAVPLGTMVYDDETDELIGDITLAGQRLLVAQGGFHGLGNARFKSSINRTPRQTTPGSPGEARWLRLELKLLADVGLLGFPNAGKSTFIRSISAARPKVADYPFTTLEPNLGVVRVDEERSFVVADIPGIIEGAAEGAGLGIQFLKHVSRTRLLLHFVDLLPPDDSNPIDAVKQIERELEKYNPDLAQMERWLVLNKIDLIPEEDREVVVRTIQEKLGWDGKIYAISALARIGLKQLIEDIAVRVAGSVQN